MLTQVVESLNLPSPLGNDWKGVAGEMLLPYKTVMSLDHHSSEGMMRGILQIMFEKKFTAGDFVDLLQKYKDLMLSKFSLKPDSQGTVSVKKKMVSSTFKNLECSETHNAP